MGAQEIDIGRFRKTELKVTLEKLFMGCFISDFCEGMALEEKNELVLNYMAIKQLIEKSEAR